jgi:threonine/homoserine/homoserine lactone efflux protein
MDQTLIIGLISFAFVTSITPGPNNLMLMASGANYGYRRTIPHILGINLGFASLVLAAGFGMAALLLAFPAAKSVLKLAAVAYMVWLAWKIANAAPPAGADASGRPMDVLQAAGFQWVNPKAWAMALGAVSAYGQGGGFGTILAVAGIFCLVNMPSVSTWVLAGEVMRRVLTNRRRLTLYNWTMAALLLLSLWPVVQF